MEEPLKEAETTMIHVVSPGEKNENNTITLGPTLTTEISVEGRTVRALLDSGSPVTILSLNLLFSVWVQHKKEGQTVEEWKEEVRKHVQEPSLHKRLR